MSKNGDLIVPYMGGTIKFLRASSFTGKDGRPVILDDRIQIFGERRDPANLTPVQVRELYKIIDERDDVRTWIDL